MLFDDTGSRVADASTAAYCRQLEREGRARGDHSSNLQQDREGTGPRIRMGPHDVGTSHHIPDFMDGPNRARYGAMDDWSIGSSGSEFIDDVSLLSDHPCELHDYHGRGHGQMGYHDTEFHGHQGMGGSRGYGRHPDPSGYDPDDSIYDRIWEL